MRVAAFLSTAAILTATAGFAEDTDLLVFDYSGFENADFHSAYIEKHGASPRFAFFGDEEEAFQKVRSGFRADVAHICGDSVTKWSQSDILEPWDISRIPEYTNLNKDLAGQDITGGDVYFIPVDYGSTAVAYNTDEIEGVPSLDIFLDPAYAGRVTLPDVAADSYALGYLATGVSDWTQATDEQFEAATAWLRQAHQNLRTYWTDPAELSQLLATGEVALAWAWNETLPTMVDQGFPIGFERETAEGSSLWLCGYVNLKDGEGVEDKAYDYINAMLDPSSTQPLLDAGYGHANAAAMAAFSDDDLTAVGLGPITAPVLAQLPTSEELRNKQVEMFERIKAGF
ncbi:extracellular solute-binding protein [Parasulfitobacter algicola]|uniref:Extracellular solute-binding protein n=1 Tax=Parasulfitobacter algicola TaxID=2614809 RepID=A0ABX2IS40_9RHOB|nr:extracellular solute-binding protein [Sulfitobacter algicola]NSX55711.1 extracellular solute-binding protein [Sulfitobacter algicola]